MSIHSYRRLERVIRFLAGEFLGLREVDEGKGGGEGVLGVFSFEVGEREIRFSLP